MGNCCCYPTTAKRNGNKRLRKGHAAKRYYKKYGCDEDDYNYEDDIDTSFDYDMQTTRSSLSTNLNKSKQSLYDRRNKILLKNHSQLIAQKQQQQQLRQQARDQKETIYITNVVVNQTKVTNLNTGKHLYLQQSHLSDPSAARFSPKTSAQKATNEEVVAKDDPTSEIKPPTPSETCPPESMKRSSRDSAKSISTSSSPPVSISSSSILEPLTNSPSGKLNTAFEFNKRKAKKTDSNHLESSRIPLANRKRTCHLNQSLNETDLSANKQSNGENYSKSRRKISKKKHNEDDVDEYNSDDALNKSITNGNSNYRSLQKSKRSIKTIEKTLKNSKSIERWLNDFDELKESDGAADSKSSGVSQSVTAIPKSPNECFYQLLTAAVSQNSRVLKEANLTKELPAKVNSTVERIVSANEVANVRGFESDMFNFLNELILPKSMVNQEDISFLKWLLTPDNYNLFIEQPIIDSKRTYMLIIKNLEIEIDDGGGDDSTYGDPDSLVYMTYTRRKQTLNLLTSKIKNILNKEKELETERQFSSREILEEFRSKYIKSASFAGANCLLNISARKSKKDADKHLNATFNSSTTSSSSSTTTSSSGAPTSPFISNSADVANKKHPVRMDELGDKLFLCFLSNFSCKSVERFLLSANQQSTLELANSVGFVRKHKTDKSFSYVTNPGDGNSSDFDVSRFKLMFRLNKWPNEFDFTKRNRCIPKDLLEYIVRKACVVSPVSESGLSRIEDEESELETEPKWKIDTSLAETLIFKSFTRRRQILFWLSYYVLNNIDSDTTPKNSIRIGHYRLLLHHMLAFFDMNNQIDSSVTSYEHVCRFIMNFSSFLRLNVLNKHKSLTRPNYFNTNLDILDPNELNKFRISNASPDSNLSDPKNATTIANLLHKLEASLKKGARFYELNLEQAFKSKPNYGTQLWVEENRERLFNQYLLSFYRVLFSQFKSKRDNFKINEQVLMEIHASVSRECEGVADLDLDGVDLLTKFELYAECVHKYLPQIRQYNKYLLFHYIWTMQVQYLTPFFNYICDIYKAYD